MPDASQLAIFVPIIALMIPIVAILVKHQQRMAEILSQRQQADPTIDSLRREIAEVKSLLHEQAIQMDNLKQLPSHDSQTHQQVSS